MKIYFLFIFLFLFSVSSCDSDNDFTVSEQIIIVDSKTEIKFDEVHNIERPYLRVKFQEDATEWTSVYGISGFDYEEGYVYVLKVKEKVLKKPLEDQLKTNYEFMKLISKTKVTEISE
jgi:hypothetical protein